MQGKKLYFCIQKTRVLHHARRMKTLFLFQFASFIFMLVNAFIIGIARLQVKWVSRRYEQSRWLLFAGIMGLAAQYFIQMRYGFRAAGDAQGAVVNVIIYTPCFTLTSMAIYNLEATHTRRRKMSFVCGGIYAAILACFCIGFLQSGSLHIGAWLYAMLALFLACVVYCICTIICELVRRRNILETMTGGDLVPYVRYAQTGLLILLLTVLVVSFAIISTKLLCFVASFALLSLLFFVMNFVALGNSYVPTDELLNAEEEQRETPSAEKPDVTMQEDKGNEPPQNHQPCLLQDSNPLLPDDRIKLIRMRLDGWCDGFGYKDSTVNLLSLSRSLSLPKGELSRFFDQCLKTNFRIWLSDIRFCAAKKMMLDFPDYSNDIISSECGFSSRTHLYRIFKAREGCTPIVWRERQLALRNNSCNEPDPGENV